MTSPLLDAIDGGHPPRLSAADALAHFDELPSIDETEMRGRWQGWEVSTGHPLDGVLAKVAWYGKQFDAADRVHPVLVRDSRGRVFPMNPRLVRLWMLTSPPPTPSVLQHVAPQLMSLLSPVVSTATYGAQLQTIEYRGVRTAAMRYLDKPVTDVFRKLDDHTVLGLMDYPGMPYPYYFLLRREPSAARA
ncbi:GXWXG domain-containing protein [Mycobacterium sp. Aquia_216]|uniref:GXWXG domain-containing protein n=1 Tax=Mycobacterium sp. Aquia_216 TaxID=2991729 RepID=UPI00227C28A3|nr:GXWXG domain-containing protein [Mycobacterium sp. Aquia_216]WAJ42715.1 GXWXG domain-containing protein [Mycobacterium sp. Aquia_216]